jgi:hypothetical protein
MPNYFISKAIKHVGALHKQMGVPMHKTIPMGKLKAAAGQSGKLGARARLALTLHKLGGGGPKPSPAARQSVAKAARVKDTDKDSY